MDTWKASILVAGERQTLLQLAGWWAGETLELGKQSGQAAPTSHTQQWGPDDLFALWSARDQIAACLKENGIPESDGDLAIISAIDAFFVSITTEDAELVQRALGDGVDIPIGRLPWWWHRVPLSGPIRDELLLWGSR